MKYTVNLDKNNYILSISHTLNDDTEIDLSLLDTQYLNAYRLINSEIILDEVKKTELIAEETRKNTETEINELKQKLNETDYIFSQELEEITALSNPVTFIADFIKILVSYSTKYKDIISNRKAWRDRIKELEG